MAAPSILEFKLLNEFRAQLADLEFSEFLNSDMELLRWIRARDNNLEQAELLFRKHLKWRAEMDIENIGSWESPEPCQKYLPEYVVGFDDDNHPIVVTLTGKWDVKRVLAEVGLEFFMKSLVKNSESTKDHMRDKLSREGVPVTQFIHIVDLEGLSFSNATLPVFRALSEFGRIFESNYPEFLKMAVIINAPWFFPMFFKCLTPLLSRKTTDKMHIYGRNRAEWMEFVKTFCPDRILPSRYGGSVQHKNTLRSETSRSDFNLPPSKMAAPSIMELKLLSQFRSQLNDLEISEFLSSDMELLRFIRARESNLEQAELMFRKHLKWRAEMDIDNIGSWESPDPCKKYLPEHTVGFDDDNRPLVVTLLGKWDVKHVLSEIDSKNFLKHMVKQNEETRAKMTGKVCRKGVPVTQMIHIIDLEGLSLTQGTLPVFRFMSEFAGMFESNYPEFLKMEVVINAPWFFPMFFKCVKPFLSRKTTDKIHVYGKNQVEWIEFLKKFFPDRILPSRYGGSNRALM
ncbi:unnamed protein product [Allacma fusca]|uniref:CRAL-TRIO domain-containing protein n=1 Tax=Allacma fusca TaxID=39272 RepID=A0A8J2NPL6_9HEXA|nr:unnamed protein product [Allacma fusca]